MPNKGVHGRKSQNVLLAVHYRQMVVTLCARLAHISGDFTKMSQFIVNSRRRLGSLLPYEIHDLSAGSTPLFAKKNRVVLGEFETASLAKEEALKFHPEVEDCY